MAKLIDGKARAADLRERIKQDVQRVREAHDLQPALAVVLVGEDPASQVYVGSKARQTVECGMRSIEHRLEDSTDEATLLELIESLNADDDVHGILVQLPLPKHIDEARVLDAVRFDKDVDGFHLTNVGKLATGGEGVVPCTPLGCLLLLKDALGSLSGMDAVVVGRSNIVGKPMASLLLAESCTVTIAHSRTRDLEALCRRADILVAAVGRPRMLGAEHVKPGAAVIDVGINRIDKEGGGTRLVGDVDFDAVESIAGHITPVPGGVGPMTIACLLHNTLQQACRQNGIDPPPLTMR